MTAQRALEALVLERLARLEPADLGVRRGGHGERGAAELVMLARARPAQRGVAPGGVGATPLEHGGGEVVRAELDPAADRAGARGDRVELRAQPVRRGLGVRVGGGDQAVRVQALRREVHALAARVADAGMGGLDHVQGHVARGGAGARLGRVGAAVEHEQDLVVGALHAGLGGERGDAGADQLLLVARGDDDAGLHGRRSVSIRARPVS